MYNQGILTSFNPGPDSRLRQVSIFVPKALDTLSAESSDGTFSQEQNINHTVDIDLRADQVVLSRAPRKNNAYVRFIEWSKEDTRVTLAIPIHYDRH